MKYSHVVLIFSICYTNCHAQNVSEKAAIERFEEFKEKFNPIDSFPVIGKRLPDGFAKNKISFDEATEILAIDKDSLYYWEEFYNQDTDVRTRGKRLNCFPIARFRYTYDKFTCLMYSARTSLNDGALVKTMLSTFDGHGRIIDSIVLREEMITFDGIPYNAFGLVSPSKLRKYIYDTYNEKKAETANTEVRCHEISNEGKFVLTGSEALRLNFERYDDSKIANWKPDDPMLKLLEK